MKCISILISCMMLLACSANKKNTKPIPLAKVNPAISGELVFHRSRSFMPMHIVAVAIVSINHNDVAMVFDKNHSKTILNEGTYHVSARNKTHASYKSCEIEVNIKKNEVKHFEISDEKYFKLEKEYDQRIPVPFFKIIPTCIFELLETHEFD